MTYISVNKITLNANQDSQKENSPEKKLFEYIRNSATQIIQKRQNKFQNKRLFFIEKVLINQFLILNLNETDDFALFINLLFYFTDKFNYYSFFKKSKKHFKLLI